jgi:hypothetical protein
VAVEAGGIVRASDIAAVACRVMRSTNQSIPDDTMTTVTTLTTEVYDIGEMHSTVSNSQRITFPVGGVYVVGFQGRFASASDYRVCQAVILMNGATEVAVAQFSGTSNAIPQRVFVTSVYSFSAGDYIEAQVYQDNTANASRNLEFVAGQSPVFWAARVGS